MGTVENMYSDLAASRTVSHVFEFHETVAIRWLAEPYATNSAIVSKLFLYLTLIRVRAQI